MNADEKQQFDALLASRNALRSHVAGLEKVIREQKEQLAERGRRIQELEHAKAQTSRVNKLEAQLMGAENQAAIALARFSAMRGRVSRLRRALALLADAVDGKPGKPVRDALRYSRGVLQSEGRINPADLSEVSP